MRLHLELVLILVLAHLFEVLKPTLLIILVVLILDGGVHHVLLAQAVTLPPLHDLLLTQVLLIFRLKVLLQHFIRMCFEFLVLLHLQYVIAEFLSV